MLRWLLTVLALQFLLGAGASAFAHAAPAVPQVPNAEAVVADALQATHLCGEPSGPAADGAPAAVQGGADGMDLPDDQEFPRIGAWLAGAHFACPRLAGPLPVSPVPQRWLRPPRA